MSTEGIRNPDAVVRVPYGTATARDRDGGTVRIVAPGGYESLGAIVEKPGDR